MKEHGKEKLKTELEGIVQSLITQLDSNTKFEVDPTTSLNYAIYDYRGIEYDKKSVMNYIKEKRVPEKWWKRWPKLISSSWVIFSCEITFLFSFLIYAIKNNIPSWKFIWTEILFGSSLMLYVIIKRYLKSKELIFRECVNVNIIIQFDKYHWVKYGISLSVLVLGIWVIILFQQDQDLWTFYSAIVSPFVGIAGAFIADIVGFSDSIYSLHDYVEDLGDGVINQSIIIIPERIFILI